MIINNGQWSPCLCEESMISSIIRSNHHHRQWFCLNLFFVLFFHISFPLSLVAELKLKLSRSIRLNHHHRQRLFCCNPYLCANTLPPLFRLHVEVLHEDALALPGGVCEKEQGKANELDKMNFARWE